MLSFLMILAQLTVPLQEPAAVSAHGDQVSFAIERTRTALDGPAPRVDEEQATPAQPALPPATRRRRGSMVGYIDDAIIESKVRIRFDAGFHDTVPDRAEFFYAKCGCYADAGADPNAPGPRPGSAKDLNFQQLNVWGEYAVNDRFSAFAYVPVRWIQPKEFIIASLGGQVPFSDQSGFGDLRAGVKVGAVASDDQSLTVQGQFYFPTGDAGKGLGTDHASFEPALLYYQRVSDVVVLESQVGVWFPIGGSSAFPGASDGDFSGNVFYYGIGSSFEIYKRDRVQFAPVIELVGWHVASGFQTIEGPAPDRAVTAPRADGTNIVNLKFGARITVDRGSFYVGYGHALTDASWYDDIVRFEYRFSF
jgi:hypothetical protein